MSDACCRSQPPSRSRSRSGPVCAGWARHALRRPWVLLWWLASMARWYAGYVGMDDPHLVALALMTSALAYALRDPNSKRAEGAIVLMALAGFYKHNLVAIPAATLCWWTLQDYRRGASPGFAGHRHGGRQLRALRPGVWPGVFSWPALAEALQCHSAWQHRAAAIHSAGADHRRGLGRLSPAQPCRSVCIDLHGPGFPVVCRTGPGLRSCRQCNV